jgi:hypothetical protein
MLALSSCCEPVAYRWRTYPIRLSRIYTRLCWSSCCICTALFKISSATTRTTSDGAAGRTKSVRQTCQLFGSWRSWLRKSYAWPFKVWSVAGLNAISIAFSTWESMFRGLCVLYVLVRCSYGFVWFHSMPWQRACPRCLSRHSFTQTFLPALFECGE